jgi:hypothetical protein
MHVIVIKVNGQRERETMMMVLGRLYNNILLNKIQTKAVFIFVCDFQLCLLRILVYKGRRDRMVVGFTTTYAINTYHYQRCEFESHSGDTTLCYKVCQ